MSARLWLGCGIVAGPLFVAAFVVHGAVLDGYSPVRHPVSSLALSPAGWVQSVNFIVCGLLAAAFAVGLRTAARGSNWGPLLIGVWGLSLVAAGVFVTDPVSGYPAGTPLAQGPYTTAGFLHDLAALVTLVTLPVACLVLARRFPRRGWTVYSVVTAVVFPAFWIMAGLGFGQDPNLTDLAGLFQRTGIVVAWAWITVLALTEKRAGERPTASPGSMSQAQTPPPRHTGGTREQDG
ncbi:DUF998 domain-containing protein [Nonomuraea sp. NPDC050790]|uniref:DUF998 domain-containing protein n=1 Tax=Nonomuraea sp. NPDC050790 TaxID=3364371 RepID=UPI00378CE05D